MRIIRYKVSSVKVERLRELIESERGRLKALSKRDKGWWADESRSDWARREFGNDLNAPINEETIRCEGENCNICGEDFLLDEEFIRLEFSFCSEYDCEMNIHLKCLRNLAKKLR